MRLAAADQQIARGWRLDWVRPVGDGAGNQPRLAVVTNSGAARPAHRHVARLSQFEQAVECGNPVDSEIAARARPEILGVEAVTGDPPACKAVDETAHKRGWAADVEIRIGRNAHFLERVYPHASHPVEIDIRPIGWLWRTVTNVAAASGQGLEELAHLRRKWMLAAVAGTVKPPNLSPRLLGGQCVQHGKDWGGADAGTDKDHGMLAPP